MNKKQVVGLALGALLGLGGSSAMATATLCSAYVAAGDNTELFRENMSLNGTMSDNCYGHASFSPNDPASVRAFANTNNLFGASDWTEVARTTAGNAQENIAAYFGLKFSIINVFYDASTYSGTFDLKVTDINGAAPLNLGALVDLVGTVKSSTYTDFFFFDDEVINALNSGTYKMSYTAGASRNPAGLSDITFLARGGRDQDVCQPGDPTCTPQRIPEPGTVALVGLALTLMALGSTRRRTQRRR